MDAHEFETALKADGFTEIQTSSYDARPANGEHGHHFSVRGLVLAGAFTVNKDKQPVTYRPGEVFTVEQGQLHFEEIGAEGAASSPAANTDTTGHATTRATSA